MFRRIARVLCVLLMSTAAVSGGSVAAQSGYPSNRASISIGPNNASGSPGQVVSFHVGVSAQSSNVLRPSYSGSVLVTVPVGLTVVGSPACGSGCRKVFIEDDADGGSKLEASIDIYDGESASFSFQVMINSSAKVGSTYSLWAHLLGSFVSTPGWTSVATLTVVDAPPARGATTAFNAYLSVTPESLRIAPGGSTLYYIQPVFLFQTPGDSANLPNYTVRVKLPKLLSLKGDPICGPRQWNMPRETTCDVEAGADTDGSTTITSHPGFVDASSNGLYIPIEIEKDAPIGSAATIEVSMRVNGDLANSEQPRDVAATILVSDAGDAPSQSEPGTVSGLIEVQQGFMKEGDSCSTDYMYEGTQLALYTEINGEMLSYSSVRQGYLTKASDGTDREVCVFGFTFSDARGYSVYVVTYMPASGDAPCRACVLGLLTTPTMHGLQTIVEARGRLH